MNILRIAVRIALRIFTSITSVTFSIALRSAIMIALRIDTGLVLRASYIGYPIGNHD